MQRHFKILIGRSFRGINVADTDVKLFHSVPDTFRHIRFRIRVRQAHARRHRRTQPQFIEQIVRLMLGHSPLESHNTRNRQDTDNCQYPQHFYHTAPGF